MMEDQTQRRIAANEAVFRDVNDAIQRGQWPGEEGSPTAFRCECARLDCNKLIELTPGEYEAIRAHSKRFVVLPGHERPEVETVVEIRDAYVIVEKRDEAGRLAQATDPRS
jgi:hypothetical protein